MDLQVDLKLDYNRNLQRYGFYQQYFRSRQPRLLAVWGRNDLFFIPAGAEAFKRGLPDAKIAFLNTGHFALETKEEDIAEKIERFF